MLGNFGQRHPEQTGEQQRLLSADQGQGSGELRRLIDQHPGDLPEEQLDRVFMGWTHLFGMINFEVFGRLDGTIQARAEYFDHHMALMADLAGIPR